MVEVVFVCVCGDDREEREKEVGVGGVVGGWVGVRVRVCCGEERGEGEKEEREKRGGRGVVVVKCLVDR